MLQIKHEGSHFVSQHTLTYLNHIAKEDGECRHGTAVEGRGNTAQQDEATLGTVLMHHDTPARFTSSFLGKQQHPIV